jgi:hypothetical protein
VPITAQDKKISQMTDVAPSVGMYVPLVDLAQPGLNFRATLTSILALAPAPSFASITGKPTTLAGYGITDAITAAAVASGYQPLDSDLTAIAALGTTAYGRGFLTLADATAAQIYIGAAGFGTVTSVDITPPAAGITASGGPVTTSGNITLALADDLAALEALSGTDTIYYRSGVSTWTAVTIGGNMTFTGGVLDSVAGGGGTVSSFSSGNLSPLFTTSVATATTTPALSFSLSTQSANLVFAGPTGGGAAAPTFRSLVAADIPSLSAVYQPLDAALTALATGSDFVVFSGPATSNKTFTLPNASSTILTSNAAVTVPQGGTGLASLTYAYGLLAGGTTTTSPLQSIHPGLGGQILTSGGIGFLPVWINTIPVPSGGTGRNSGTTAYGLIAAGTTATGIQQTLPAGATTQILVGGGASALPVWTTATGTGSPVRATSPTLVTPDLGTPSALVVTNATGTASININGTVGATTPDAGSFTVVNATGVQVGSTTLYGSPLGFIPSNQINSTGAAGSSMMMDRWSTNTAGPRIVLAKANSAAIGTQGALTIGQENGELLFAGSDGTDIEAAASIVAITETNAATNDMRSAIAFRRYVNSVGAELARISYTGNWLVGTSSESGLTGAGNISITNSLLTGAPATSTANTLKVGAYTDDGSLPITTGYVIMEIGGVNRKMAVIS